MVDHETFRRYPASADLPTMAALSTGRSALVLFDDQFVVVLRNAEAEILMSRGLIEIDGCSRLIGPLAGKLRRRLDNPEDQTPLVLRAPDRSESYLGAFVTPVRPAAVGSACFYALIVRDAHAELRARVLELARRDRLTEQEQRMLMLIVDGADPGAAARTLGIALSTARTHLQRCFEKTGVTRQSELVSLVARFVGGD